MNDKPHKTSNQFKYEHENGNFGTNSNTGAFTHYSSANSVYCTCSSGAASGGDGGFIDELRISSTQRTNFNLPCMTCPPAVNVKLLAGLVINGPIGSNYNIQATSAINSSNWTTLTNIPLQSVLTSTAITVHGLTTNSFTGLSLD